tara:strand:+ start:22238 stop:22462 length:225 start_codon:yes stop_codon:yes gene_type:complete
MSPEVTVRIREAVSLAGKALEGSLPESPKHQTRNPYAHIWRCIKTKMGKSYKDCADSDEKEIIEYIEYLVNNPF